MTETRFSVPSYLWISLEATLQAESRKLVKEIAATLGQNEAVLWKEVSKEKLSAYLIDMTDPTNETQQCIGYTLESIVQKPCTNPVIFGKKTCPYHVNTIIKKPDSSLPKYRRLKYFDEEEKVCYVNSSTNDVVDCETLLQIGRWNPETQSLTVFEAME
jgi:hypothetical protein